MSAYGDLDFDAAKFPDAPGMVRQLRALGFKVTVWVMPFAEENSAAYRCARAPPPAQTFVSPALQTPVHAADVWPPAWLTGAACCWP